MERAGNKSHCPCRACPCLQIQPHSIKFALLSWLATNSARSPLGSWQSSASPSLLGHVSSLQCCVHGTASLAPNPSSSTFGGPPQAGLIKNRWWDPSLELK